MPLPEDGAGSSRAQAKPGLEIDASTSAARLEREQWELLVDASPGALMTFEIDLSGASRCTLLGDSSASVLGITPEEVRHDVELFRSRLNPDDRAAMREEMTRAAGDRRVLCFEVTYQHPQQGPRWLEIRARPEPRPGGGLTVYAFIADISERKRLTVELNNERERAVVTLASIGDAVITTDSQGVIEYLNPVAEQLTGWPTEEAAGQPVSQVFRIRNELTGQPADDPALRCLKEGRIAGLTNHTALIARDGRMISINDSAAPIRGADGSVLGTVLVFHDVTEQRQRAGELHHQATHDVLTGLPNRREFDRQLNQLIGVFAAPHRGTARRGDPRPDPSIPRHALCYIDLDRFKMVNDTCGHVAGDELLRQLSEALRARVRQMDTLARLGGDEFGLLLRDCPLGEAITVANELCLAVEEFRFAWGAHTFRLGASVGLVPILPTARSAVDLLEAADSACYLAKKLGGHRVHVYEPGDTDAVQQEGALRWIQQIHCALDEDRFALHAQPIHAAGPSGEARHYELLLRMVAPDGSLVLPSSFLPSAERHGLARKMDKWVLRAAFGWLAANPTALPPAARCWINLSNDSIRDPELSSEILELLSSLSLSGDRLCFEVTESVVVTHLGTVRALIAALSQRGCQFALEDFGSGLSSFSFLRSLPVDYIKIDGTFVKGIAHDPVDSAIVRSINDVGHLLGRQTVAERVDSVELREVVSGLGLDLVQGDAIGRVVPLISLSQPRDERRENERENESDRP